MSIRDFKILLTSLNDYFGEKLTLFSFACQTENYDIEDALKQQYPQFINNDNLDNITKRIILIDPNYWEEYPIVESFNGYVVGTPKFLINYEDDGYGNIILKYDDNAELVIKDDWKKIRDNKNCRLMYINKYTNTLVQCFQTLVSDILCYDDVNQNSPMQGFLKEEYKINDKLRKEFYDLLNEYIKKVKLNDGIVIFYFPWNSECINKKLEQYILNIHSNIIVVRKTSYTTNNILNKYLSYVYYDDVQYYKMSSEINKKINNILNNNKNEYINKKTKYLDKKYK